ncbi:ABC transporter permease [Paenibacillus cymbidii]|uniref:ABC transporter permease n=1 Tax=Paenibacillus cymbidii TaxID=1639034 RepID=UPI001081D7D9|nr:ABC transporter permease [Paenibacillus cymbidii]
MLKYTLRRTFYMLVTLWLIATLTFLLMKLLPGDPFGEASAKLSPANRRILYEQYGLDKPIWQQYLKFLNDLLHGDLGVSFQFPARRVTEVIRQAFPASLELGLLALAIAIVAGLTLGLIAALNHNRFLDRVSMVTAVIGISIPSFVLGPLLSLYIGVKLKWLPPGLWTGPAHRILPAIALSFGTVAILARLMRTSMLDVLNNDYIKTAKTKGLSGSSIVWRHTIRNAILPVVTILGPVFVNVVTGTFVVEKIFAVPGLGTHFVSSVSTNDYTMIAGLTIFYSAILVVVLFLTDLLYGLIDPRIRLGKGRS